MEGIDAIISWKPDLEHKTGYCGPQGPKSGQKPIDQCVRMYLCMYVPPLRFATISLRATKFKI